MFVVVVDGGDGLDSGIVGAGVVLAVSFLVPVEDAADEGEMRVTLASALAMALVQAEEQGHVAVDASFSRYSAAWMPSQVEASLIRTRSRETRPSHTGAMMSRAVSMDLAVS